MLLASPQLEALAEAAAVSGEPLVRPMWWHAPTDPTCQWVADQFLLGNTTLVSSTEPLIARRAAA